MWVATLSRSLSLIPVYHSTAWCCQDVVTCHWTSIHFCLEGCNDTLQGVRCRSLFIHLIMEFICALTLLLDIARHILRKRWMFSYVISCLNRWVSPLLPRTSSKSGPWMHQATHTYSSQHYTHVHSLHCLSSFSGCVRNFPMLEAHPRTIRVSANSTTFH